MIKAVLLSESVDIEQSKAVKSRNGRLIIRLFFYLSLLISKVK